MSAISGNFILGKNTMEPNADQAEITDAIMGPADESGTEKYVDKLDLDMLKLGSSWNQNIISCNFSGKGAKVMTRQWKT